MRATQAKCRCTIVKELTPKKDRIKHIPAWEYHSKYGANLRVEENLLGPNSYYGHVKIGTLLNSLNSDLRDKKVEDEVVCLVSVNQNNTQLVQTEITIIG